MMSVDDTLLCSFQVGFNVLPDRISRLLGMKADVATDSQACRKETQIRLQCWTALVSIILLSPNYTISVLFSFYYVCITHLLPSSSRFSSPPINFSHVICTAQKLGSAPLPLRPFTDCRSIRFTSPLCIGPTAPPLASDWKAGKGSIGTSHIRNLITYQPPVYPC